MRRLLDAPNIPESRFPPETFTGYWYRLDDIQERAIRRHWATYRESNMLWVWRDSIPSAHEVWPRDLYELHIDWPHHISWESRWRDIAS
jgi:hypothetical protein